MSAAGIGKAVILARGLGTRMRRADGEARVDDEQGRAADAGVKALIPVGRPFLDYVLGSLADAGFGDVCLVIGPEHGAVRERYGRELEMRRLRVHFAVQASPRGTADAVAAAEAFAGDDDFLVINSDNLYPTAVLRALRELPGPGLALFSGRALVRESNIPADRLRAFAILSVDAAGYLTEIIEKPDVAMLAPFGDDPPVSMNCWRFPKAIFAACRAVTPSQRKELELPDAVRATIRAGVRYAVVRSASGVLDLTQRGDIAAVTARLRDVSVEL
jgi:glucose-1-phosphate thymidylyltransferase